MKKICCQILFVVSLFGGLGCMSACSEDNQNEIESAITLSDLPQSAQSFLMKYFSDTKVSKIEEELDGNVNVYVVNLENGYEVVFNSQGEWQEVDAPNNMEVPAGILPEPVARTLKEQYPGFGVLEINTTGKGWKVQLSDNQGGPGIDIWFNMSGEILSTSIDNQ